MKVHKKRCSISISTIFLILFCLSCSGTRSIRPVPEGHERVDVSLGGPLVKAGGIYVPAPVTSVAYTRGVAKNGDLHVALHPTAALFGIFVLEGGGCYQLNEPVDFLPGISLSPRAFIMTKFTEKTWRLYPDLQMNLFWDVKKNWLVYGGMSSFFELNGEGTAGRSQPYNIVLSPLIGTEVKWGNYQWQFELRWHAANANSAYVAPDYIGIADYGALGPIISLKRTW